MNHVRWSPLSGVVCHPWAGTCSCSDQPAH